MKSSCGFDSYEYVNIALWFIAAQKNKHKNEETANNVMSKQRNPLLQFHQCPDERFRFPSVFDVSPELYTGSYLKADCNNLNFMEASVNRTTTDYCGR